jgi:hypothetical protein
MEHKQQEKRQKKPKKHRFYKVLLLCIAFMLVLIFAGMIYFWGYLGSYEASRLDNLIQEMQNNIDYAFWERNAVSALALRYTEFESGDSPFIPHLHTIHDVQYSFRQKIDEDYGDAPVYIIRAGARDIGVVRFVAIESVGHGFYSWEVESIEFLDSFIAGFCRSVSITVSQNAEVIINGVLVSQDYRVDCDFEYGATYVIDNLFGEIEISVIELNGQMSAPTYSEDDEYFFPIIIPFERHFIVIAPRGVSVFVDGELISTENITENQIGLPIFARLFRPGEAPMVLQRYEFEMGGFYLEPEVTAVDAHGVQLDSYIADNGEITLIEPSSAEFKGMHEGLVQDFALAYFNYAANIENNPRTNFANISEFMVRDVILYRRMRDTSYLRFTGIGSSSSFTVNSLDISTFRPYDDSFFTCEVFYNLTIQTATQTEERTGSLVILFELHDEKWLVLDMIRDEIIT